MLSIPVLEPRPSLAIKGSHSRFPVRRAFCIGRNYAAHAREMGANPEREAPFFFSKFAESILPVDDETLRDLPYASMSADYHHEVELVVALASGGKNIAENEALRHVFGFAVGLDMTRRDLQAEAKKHGRPWDIAKAADASGPVGCLVPYLGGAVPQGFIRLYVDGASKQASSLSQMIWSIPEQIATISRYFELRAGDLIFTGTPEGVGAVQPSQVLHAEIEGLPSLHLRVVS